MPPRPTIGATFRGRIPRRLAHRRTPYRLGTSRPPTENSSAPQTGAVPLPVHAGLGPKPGFNAKASGWSRAYLPAAGA